MVGEVTGAARLPAGVELYSFDADGVVTRTDAAGARPLGGVLRFIDDDQVAHYFVGDAHTSPERPSNATYKLGIVAPHSAFTPHAHGGEHFVLSLGHASCGLYDERRDTAVDLRLTPGTLVRIPAMMPHSFGNRAGRPLLILAANTGYGIDHEDYAITAASGIEGRAPLFDRAVVDHAFRIPPTLKLNGTVEKWVLKEAVRDLLPGTIVDRPKSGMRVPVQQWLHGPLRDLGHDLLLGPTARARGLFRPATIESWLRREGTLLPRQGGKLWLLLTLELWLRAYDIQPLNPSTGTGPPCHGASMGDLGPTEIRQMQGLAQEVTARWPELVNGDATVGELAWVWAKDFDALNQFWRHRLWFVDGKLAGWGWAYLPHRIPRSDGTFVDVKSANLIWQVHPDRPELLAEILDWYDDVAGGVDRLLTLQSADVRALATATAHGYAFDTDIGSDNGSWVQFNVRELTDVPDPVLPQEFRFLAAADVSVTDAVDAHRDAWHLSSFSEAALTRVQRTWPYRADLHVLVEAPDGTLAANAIIWLDEVTRTAEFEPVGTHRDFRRRGLGTALQLHGMRLARAAGADRMMVACLGAPAHSAARDMYFGVGFRELSRDVPQIKVAG